MIIPALHRTPVPLDGQAHRTLKARLPVTDWSPTRSMNALFVAATEFGDVCREYAIVFIRAGASEGGVPDVAPICVLGMLQEQNLYLQPDHGWRASYMPAVLRVYPFFIGRLDAERQAVCIDTGWPGLNDADGTPLFTPDGQPSTLITEVQKHLETLEGEIERTRLVGRRLQELDLLKDMRFEATLPGGQKHSIDGFLTVDEAKMQALPDAQVGELHRSGILGLIHLHWLSLPNMRRLVEWHVATLPALA